MLVGDEQPILSQSSLKQLMSNHKKVMVLLASRNGANWIREQLDSILAQQGVDVSILVQDDKSTDDTASIITQYADTAPERISIILNETGTGSAGANFRKLIARTDLSAFDYVALADQDDIWDHDKLARGIAAMRRTGAHGYSAAVNAFWPGGKESVLAQSSRQRSLDFIFEGAGQGCTFILPVAGFEVIQEFCRQHAAELAEFHFHDWLIYILVRAAGGFWYFDPEPVMRYRQHENNDIGARGGLASLRRRVAMVKQGWYGKQVALAMNIFRLAGGMDARADALQVTLQAPFSWKRRVSLARISGTHGRRRLADRGALILFALLGWL